MIENPAASAGAVKRLLLFDPQVRKIPWRKAWQPTPYSCLENPMVRDWLATVPGVAKSQNRLKQQSTRASVVSQ